MALSYRYLGKQKTLSLGTYPDVTPIMARERLGETKKLLASGRDPAVQAKLAKITRAVAAANSLSQIATEQRYQKIPAPMSPSSKPSLQRSKIDFQFHGSYSARNGFEPG